MIEPTPPVAILMGSQSDWATLRHAADTLDSLGIAHDDRIISAHRTPDRLITFCKGRLAAYKYPRYVEFLDEVPKTVTGKFLRRELRGR